MYDKTPRQAALSSADPAWPAIGRALGAAQAAVHRIGVYEQPGGGAQIVVHTIAGAEVIAAHLGLEAAVSSYAGLASWEGVVEGVPVRVSGPRVIPAPTYLDDYLPVGGAS